MRERFAIDGLHYELGVNHRNAVVLALIGGANPVFDAYPRDPFDWELVESNITREIHVSRYPLRVYRRALTLLQNWLGSARPPYFEFSLCSRRRYWLYERLARQLAERFDYDLQCIGLTFYFFKLKQEQAGDTGKDTGKASAMLSHSLVSSDGAATMHISAEELSRRLFELDPMGTCCKENDCFDEYDALAEAVEARLEMGQSLESALREEMEVSFGDLAERLDTRSLSAQVADSEGPA